MKKLLFLIAIAVLPATRSYCQKTAPGNYLSVSAGGSFPVGNFLKTDPANNEAGFAAIGQNLSLNYTYKFNQHLGAVAAIYGQRNGLNTSKMEDAYSNAGFFGYTGAVRKYPNWEVQKNPWLTGALMVGLSEEFPIARSKRCAITITALTGIAYVQSPKIIANSKTDTSYTELKRDKSHSLGQSFLVEGGGKYSIGKRTFLTLKSAYFTTNKIKFEDVYESVFSSDGGLIIPGLYSLKNAQNIIGTEFNGRFSQRISSLNFNLGFALSL